MTLRFCVFCGEENELELKHGLHRLGYKAHVHCGHCAATGSCFIEDTLGSALQKATSSWNEAYREALWVSRIKYLFNSTLYRIGL